MIFTQAVNAIKKDQKPVIQERIKKAGMLDISKKIRKIEIQQNQYKVFLRNLPQNLELQDLKDLATSSTNFGIKIEKDSAECFFKLKNDAHSFVEIMNGKFLQGKKIKAILVEEETKRIERTNTEPQKESIFNRIKKRN